jgi:hypothetical protein
MIFLWFEKDFLYFLEIKRIKLATCRPMTIVGRVLETAQTPAGYHDSFWGSQSQFSEISNSHFKNV